MDTKSGSMLFTHIGNECLMMINVVKQLIRNETSGSQNIDTKKLVSTALATGLILSPLSYQFLQANTGLQNLPGKVVIENISISNQWNATCMSDTVMYDNDRDNFLLLRYAIEKGANKDPWSNVDVNNNFFIAPYASSQSSTSNN